MNLSNYAGTKTMNIFILAGIVVAFVVMLAVVDKVKQALEKGA